MDYRAVVFHQTGARIFHGVDPNKYRHVRGCVVNPEYPKGVPPHYWKLVEGKIVEMSAMEKKERDATLLSLGLHDTPPVVPISEHSYLTREFVVLAAIAATFGGAIAAAIHFLF